jgi:lipoprotein-anchoring transpeptidase ErfK/SrfK
VGWLIDDWYESRSYPDGWMYRPQFFNMGQAIHGSSLDSAVHSYPASHGCVRMLHKDIDYLWANGFGKGSVVNVYGTWRW